jgi:molecular chaperone GrpE
MSKKAHRVAELAAYKSGTLKPEGAEEDKERYLRLAAEFDNFKKRTARQYAEIISNANEAMILELLDVIDDFQRALESAADGSREKSDDSVTFLEGMRLIYDKLMSVLKNRGVEPMDVVDKPFDPVYHEAVMQAASEKEEGMVIGVISPGYMLNGRVIRHAKVVVASESNS